MAIKKTVKTNFGIEIQDAYHRVENVSLISKNQISFHIRSRVDADHSVFQETLIQCQYDIDGENPIAQAYAYIKTLPEFAGAVNC